MAMRNIDKTMIMRVNEVITNNNAGSIVSNDIKAKICSVKLYSCLPSAFVSTMTPGRMPSAALT